MVISVPAVEKEALTLGAIDDGNTTTMATSAAAPRGASRAIISWSAPTGKARRPRIKKVFPSDDSLRITIFRTQLFNPETCRTWRRCRPGYKAAPLSAFLKQPAPPAAPKIDFVPATTEGIKKNFYEYLTPPFSFVPASPEDKDVRARLASIASGR